MAATPDSSKVYVANTLSDTVSVIDTATNTVTATILVGTGTATNPFGPIPVALGVFIQPRFAGVPGSGNCLGTSLAALAKKFAGLNAAAAALGFSNVQGLEDVIEAFCEG